MKAMYVTILNEMDVKGKNSLKIFEKCGLEASPTELARHLGSLPEKEMSAPYWVDSNPADEYPDQEKFNVVSTTGATGWEVENKRNIGIRLTMPNYIAKDFNISKAHLRKQPNGQIVKVKEFGEYPQTFVKEADINLDALQLTGKKYTFDQNVFPDEAFEPMWCSEYQDTKTGNKYIQIQTDVVEIDDGIGAEHNYVEEPQMEWVKVEPITWIEDPQTHELISERVLVAGIQGNFANECEYPPEPGYAEEILSKEILPTDQYLKTIENLKPDDEYFKLTGLRQEYVNKGSANNRNNATLLNMMNNPKERA